LPPGSSSRCSRALRPALRATRVPPIAAVREGAMLPESRFARFRTAGSIVLTGLGFASLLWGLFGPGLGTAPVLTFMGIGALLIFFGVSMLSVRLIRPLAGALGWPATRIGGVAGVLARDNARRNPQRTASTAAALMIGLALVTLVAVLAAGITTSFRSAVDKIWNADYAVTAQNNFSPIPTGAANAAAKTPGVVGVANVRVGDVKAFGKTFFRDCRQPARQLDLPPRLDARIRSRRWRPWATTAPSPTRATRSRTNSRSARPSALTFTNGKRKTFRIKGIFEPACRRQPVREGDRVTGGLGSLQREPAQSLYVHPRARR